MRRVGCVLLLLLLGGCAGDRVRTTGVVYEPAPPPETPVAASPEPVPVKLYADGDFVLHGQTVDGARHGEWIEVGPHLVTYAYYDAGLKVGTWKVYNWDNELVFERRYFGEEDKPVTTSTELIRSAVRAWVHKTYGYKRARSGDITIEVLPLGFFAEVACAVVKERADFLTFEHTVAVNPRTGEVISMSRAE